MDPAARIGYVGDSDTLEVVENDLGERLAFAPVGSLASATEIDCLLCVGTLPEMDGETPVVVLTDDENAATEARLSGTRVLPMSILDQPEILLAQIEAAVGDVRRTHEKDGRLANAITDTVEDLIYAFNDEGLIYWNDRVSEISDLGDDELAAAHPLEFFSDDDAKRIESAISDCERTQLPVTVEVELTGSDGNAVPYEFTNSLLLEGGTEIGICGVGRNVSEYKHSLETLERLLDGTRELMAAEDGISVAETAVAAANEVLGLSHSGICLADGKRLEPVAYTDAVERSLGTVPTLGTDSLAWEVFESGDDRVYEHVHEESGIYNPDTHLRSEMIFSLGEYGVLLAGADEQCAFDDADIYFAKLLAAATESALDRADREDELEHKNAQLEEFIGVVSHDLRNPLNVATGALKLAVETGSDEHLQQVEKSHERMNEIIEGLLVLAREGKVVGVTRPVVVGTVAKEAWTTVETNGATLDIGDDCVIHADRNRLRQLFENAFRNSVEHSSTCSRNPERSSDSVEHSSTADRDSKSEVTVTVETGEDGFSISDDGPGMTMDERSARLEAGFETGEGFGLAIIRTIAAGHGWGLALEEGDFGGLRIEISTNGDGRSSNDR